MHRLKPIFRYTRHRKSAYLRRFRRKYALLKKADDGNRTCQ
nr:MAG TPA: hypothetical protein [Siphoviridae sp. ctjRi1]